MALIFVSHSSQDDAIVNVLEAWLNTQGFTDYFIDHSSIVGGEKWASSLRNAAATCRVVICLVTENWLSSPECYAEFNAAWYMGKRIIPLLLINEKGRLAPDAKSRLAKVQAEDQGLDISPLIDNNGLLNFCNNEAKAACLSNGLRAAGASLKIGLDPKAFEIMPEARPSPFPGLLSFGDDDMDAALFYGRSREITSTLEELRKLRANGARTPFGILGICAKISEAFSGISVVGAVRGDGA